MPHFPVLLYHLVPTSLRPRPHPPRLKRVRIHQPTNSTRLCSSTHTPEVSVPKGVATTCGDGTSPATADPTHKPNPAPPPVLAPRASRFAPRASRLAHALANEYPAQQQQGTGTNDEWTPAARHVYGYHPVFLSSCLRSLPSVQCQGRLRRHLRRTCPPHWHRLARSLRPLTHTAIPRSVRVVWCLGEWECVYPRSGCKCQY